MAKHRKKGHMAGGKITRSHTTVIVAAEKAVKLLDDSPEVTKIRLGIITRTSGRSRRSLKCSPINGGLKVEVWGFGYKQEIYAYTRDLCTTEKWLSEVF